jgi:saxitoxin biosynthesis operon SxtJ-like protein
MPDWLEGLEHVCTSAKRRSRTGAVHEEFRERTEVRRSSDRSFGFVFAGAFLVLALIPLLRGGEMRPWAIGIAAAFLALALLRPSLLAPLNRLWLGFGALLGRITNPVVMAVLFFFVVTPIALILRLQGKDALRLKFDRAARSYWIDRVPPGPAPASLRDQF